MINEMIEFGCYGWTDAWCAVYNLVVHVTVFVVQFLWHSVLWEDGSWGNSGAGGCLEYLGWGCSGGAA